MTNQQPLSASRLTWIRSTVSVMGLSSAAVTVPTGWVPSVVVVVTAELLAAAV